MKKVLFLCIHNSARSQMAEAFLKKYGAGHFQASSAGLEPGRINPLAVTVMKEEGIDISSNPVNDVFSYHKEGRSFDYVITVCDPAASDACPVFPGMHQKINWSFADPSRFGGSEEDRVNATRVVRDQIKNAVQEFIKAHS
jgi:arsenate reductase (thioredoxin)